MAHSAFIHGFPLTFNLDQVQRYVDSGVGANPAAPFNAFSHARTLAGPADTFVSINNDTLYSMAQIDLGVGPVLLETPDTQGRYYVLQFVDAWTNNFAYVGHRATGTAAGKYLLVPPGWQGETPRDTTLIRFPTRVGSIVGRWACNGEPDLPAVHRLQDATTLTPLDPFAVPAGIPPIDANIVPELQFLEKLRVFSQAFEPAERDMPALEALAPLGIREATSSCYAVVGPEQASEIGQSLAQAQHDVVDFLRSGYMVPVNGWQLASHAFDYNMDFFEVGALDRPEFTSLDPDKRYLYRVAAAIGGLWGNHGYEACYAFTYVDGNDEQLKGSNHYVLRLDPPPPVGAFWSLTMYSTPDFFLVPNALHRYSLGDRTPGLHYGDDGSLEIHIGAAAPEEGPDRANWLPAPAGNFRPLLRMYEPDSSIIEGTYAIPPIKLLEKGSNDR